MQNALFFKNCSTINIFKSMYYHHRTVCFGSSHFNNLGIGILKVIPICKLNKISNCITCIASAKLCVTIYSFVLRGFTDVFSICTYSIMFLSNRIL